eukprot:m.56063 g.56063  ORF g.56063 m.56063 type:complete len:50 (-) comp16932_c1_seq1:56-205(-)
MILKINDIRVGDGQYDTPSAFTLAAASTSTDRIKLEVRSLTASERLRLR